MLYFTGARQDPHRFPEDVVHRASLIAVGLQGTFRNTRSKTVVMLIYCLVRFSI